MELKVFQQNQIRHRSCHLHKSAFTQSKVCIFRKTSCECNYISKHQTEPNRKKNVHVLLQFCAFHDKKHMLHLIEIVSLYHNGCEGFHSFPTILPNRIKLVHCENRKRVRLIILSYWIRMTETTHMQFYDCADDNWRTILTIEVHGLMQCLQFWIN